jgi:acyl-CoA reductase-like NAD-dependent aldehyde dehydrogenase
MEQQSPHRVLKALLEHIDPYTGEPLAAVTVLQQAEVQRALQAGIAALEEAAMRAQRRAQLPGNIGQPWTVAEEQRLAAGFKAGDALSEIAGRHGRTLAAIEARLERMGLLTPDQRITRNRYSASEPSERG